MSGMDRLTDEELERKSARFTAKFKEDGGAACKLEANISANQFEAINLVLWGAVDARAVIAMKDDADAHRRASQAAPVASDGLREALERIAEEQMYRSGYDQTDISVEPVLSASEMQEIARAALSASPVPSDLLREALEYIEGCETWQGDDGYTTLVRLTDVRAALSASPAQEGGE